MHTKHQKYSVLVLAFFLISIQSFSQRNDSVQLKENYLGFNVAGNIYSTFTDTDFFFENRDQNFDTIITQEDFYRYSYAFGLSYKNFKEKLVGINLELNYIKKGGYNEFHEDINGNDSLAIMFQHDLEYIELPFMMNLRFGWKRLKLNFYGGPHVAWLIGQEITILENTFGRQYKDKADFNFEFGVNGGGGISYQIGKHHMIELGVRYSHGITNVFKFETINSAVFNQNQAISARAHYYYRF